jgi:peptide deformylase
MAVLPILVAPDARLRGRAAEVADASSVAALLDDMVETMRAARGVGLAAPQIGVDLRLIVVDPGGEAPPLRMVNPEIVWASDEVEDGREGCLSIPGQSAQLARPGRVRVRWREADGAEREAEADGRLARALQHEIDHLDGRLYVDRLSALKRDMILRKLAKSRR